MVANSFGSLVTINGGSTAFGRLYFYSMMRITLLPTETLLLMVAMLQCIFAFVWWMAYRTRAVEVATIRGIVWFNVIMCASLLLITYRRMYPGLWHKVIPLSLICLSTHYLIRASHTFFRAKFQQWAMIWPLVIGVVGIWFFTFAYFSDTYRLAIFLLAILIAIVLTIASVARPFVREFGVFAIRALYAVVAVLSVPMLWASYLALFTREPIGFWFADRMNDVSMFGLALGIACPNVMFAGFIGVRHVKLNIANLAKDKLTSLLNHNAFNTACDDAWYARRAQGIDAAALTIDVDQMTRINERYGHHVGDHVLATIGGLIIQVSGGSDVLARTGGQSFQILHSPATQQSARDLAARMRASLLEARWSTLIGGPSRVTVSIGIAFDQMSDVKANDLLARADRALQSAKQRGRDRIEVFEPECGRRPKTEPLVDVTLIQN
jgi:diguanylate cyclase (GGDEF)-like protein